MPLSPSTIETLRRFNPWWAGQPGPALPKHKRHLVQQIHRRLEQRTAPIVVVRGARQIGKTTAQLHVLDDLLRRDLEARHLLRVQFDELEGLRELEDPILRLVDWFERDVLGKTLNEAARAGERTLLCFDEVQNLERWAPQLKALVDSTTTQVLVTGSSALRIELGRDSLAGRITTIEAGVLSLTEIAALRGIALGEPALIDNGLDRLVTKDFWLDLAARGRDRAQARDEAFRHFSQRGGYPLGHARAELGWPAIADQLSETVIRRVIQHDLRVGERGRKRDQQLLEEVFRVACRYAGQAPTVRKIAEEASAILDVGVPAEDDMTLTQPLADALLLRAIEPLESGLRRKRGAPKLCLVDHALRAAWLQEVVPLDPAELDRQPNLSTTAGHLAESVVGATLSTVAGLDLNYLPERHNASELDFILTIGTTRIPLEVKYQSRLDPKRDLDPVRAYLKQPHSHASFGVVITRHDAPTDPRDDIVALPLSSLMMMR